MSNTRSRRPDAQIRVRGMFRLHLVEDASGRLVGDSGWQTNNVTNAGLDLYLMRAISSQAGSAQINRVMLGTGTAPGDGDTTLNGELPTAQGTTTNRIVVTVSTVASSAVLFHFTFNSSSSHITQAVTLSNIGLINSVTTGGSIFAGTTYNSSQWQTNQSVQGSYQINFSG